MKRNDHTQVPPLCGTPSCFLTSGLPQPSPRPREICTRIFILTGRRGQVYLRRSSHLPRSILRPCSWAPGSPVLVEGGSVHYFGSLIGPATSCWCLGQVASLLRMEATVGLILGISLGGLGWWLSVTSSSLGPLFSGEVPRVLGITFWEMLR